MRALLIFRRLSLLSLVALSMAGGCDKSDKKKSARRTAEQTYEAQCSAASDCADDNPCSIDDCVDGRCTSSPAPKGTSCDNTTPCDGVAQCDARGRCVAGPPPAIDDGNACTTDACDPARGVTHLPVNVDDFDVCTTDACDPRTGEITHVSVSTDDGDDCTFDSCDPQKGVTHSQANAFYTCQGGCGTGFRAASRGVDRQCGSDKALRTYCVPACGASFHTCDARCPDGYHSASRGTSGDCGGGPATFCEKNAGATLYTCDPSCPASYEKRGEGATSQCGSEKATKILCVAVGSR
jgi:hypothetical protein